MRFSELHPFFYQLIVYHSIITETSKQEILILASTDLISHHQNRKIQDQDIFLSI